MTISVLLFVCVFNGDVNGKLTLFQLFYDLKRVLPNKKATLNMYSNISSHKDTYVTEYLCDIDQANNLRL